MKSNEKDYDCWFVQILHRTGIKTVGIYSLKSEHKVKEEVIMEAVHRYMPNYPNKEELKFLVEKCKDTDEFISKVREYKVGVLGVKFDEAKERAIIQENINESQRAN